GRKIDYEHGLAGAPASVIRRTQRRGTSCYHDKLLDQGVTTLRILLSFFTRVSVCQLPSRHAAHSSSYDIHHNSENSPWNKTRTYVPGFCDMDHNKAFTRARCFSPDGDPALLARTMFFPKTGDHFSDHALVVRRDASRQTRDV